MAKRDPERVKGYLEKRRERLLFRYNSLAWEAAKPVECLVCGGNEGLFVVKSVHANGFDHFCDRKCFDIYDRAIWGAIQEIENELEMLMEASE